MIAMIPVTCVTVMTRTSTAAGHAGPAPCPAPEAAVTAPATTAPAATAPEAPVTAYEPAPGPDADDAAVEERRTVELLTEEGWFAVCRAGLLEPGRGVAALLPGGGQAALFRDSADRVWAIGNVDPFTGAAVLAHGLLGSREGRPYVASPLLKQRFDLADGRCLDDEAVAVAAYRVRLT
jgi:nitrite reductase (NADH) small subunit